MSPMIPASFSLILLKLLVSIALASSVKFKPPSLKLIFNLSFITSSNGTVVGLHSWCCAVLTPPTQPPAAPVAAAITVTVSAKMNLFFRFEHASPPITW